MKLRKYILLICIFIAIYLVPIPQKINLELPAMLYNNDIDNIDNTYKLSINAWRFNYLFKADEIIPSIKLYLKDSLILDNSSQRVKYEILKFPNDDKGNVEYISFMYYNSDTNKMESAGLWLGNDKRYFALCSNGLYYGAPAENTTEVNDIMNFFKSFYS